jgi:hypothetical protein
MISLTAPEELFLMESNIYSKKIYPFVFNQLACAAPAPAQDM